MAGSVRNPGQRPVWSRVVRIDNRSCTMNEDDREIARSNDYAYRRRYLDEDTWEPVGVDTVRRALAEVYQDVSVALDFLHEAGRIRTPAATYEAMHV